MEEVVVFFFGFWLFIFSEKFRNQFIQDWKNDLLFNKFLTIIFEVLPSIFFGLVLPFWFIFSLW